MDQNNNSSQIEKKKDLHSSNLPKNIIEKIWDLHVISQKDGHPAVFAIDFMFIHEVTSAQAFDLLREKKLKIRYPNKFIATLDHSIPTSNSRFEIIDNSARKQVEALRQNVKEFGIRIFDFESGHQGIVHVIGPELGLTQPGMTIVCGDSHTSTHGAFGALAFGIGTTEVGYVLAHNCLLQSKPKTMKVEFTGKLKKGVYSKDMILKLISIIGISGANGHIIEYTGDTIENLSIEERMTICNMSIECGARAGLIAPDNTTIEFLKGREFSPKENSFKDETGSTLQRKSYSNSNDWERAKSRWLGLRSDIDCTYDKEIQIDVSNLNPMVTWGTNPEQGIEINRLIPSTTDLAEEKRLSALKALDYIKLKENTPIKGVAIDWAFIGSCTNGRIEDLRIAASFLKDKKISENVTLYVVPGSESIYSQAENEGLKEIFEKAGASFRKPGCSMCLGMNEDKVPAGKRCISTSNRNFIGRQGTGSYTHLASPATVAVSALKGVITSPVDFIS